MSDFQAPIVKLEIREHPNAHSLEIAKIDGYECIVGKGEFRSGDLAVYIPEQSVLPQELIERLGLVDKLSGSAKNRVKAIKLRGILSQGLICPLSYLPKANKDPGYVLGQDCSDILGLLKYEPVLPAVMGGNVWYAGPQKTINYDIENIKRYTNVFVDGEEVVYSEKCHGTFLMVGRMPSSMKDEEQGIIVVSSKGQSAKGLALKSPVPADPLTLWQKIQKKFWQVVAAFGPVEGTFAAYVSFRINKIKNYGVNENNVYWRTAIQNKVADDVIYAIDEAFTEPVFILGEIFGQGIQDLAYGFTSTVPGFRVFDVYVGIPGKGRYLNDAELDTTCFKLKLDRVPVLYRGPFSQKTLMEYTRGKEAVSGKALHIREGVVVCPVVERTHPKLGRVKLKSINEDYLLRKNGTEYQ